MRKLIILILLPFFAFAASKEQVAQLLKTKHPDLVVDRIEAGPLANTYAVVTGPNIFYVSDDAKHIISGDVIELVTEKNVTEVARSKARLDSLAKLPDSIFINYPAKNSKATIVVLTDTSCGYCSRFHSHVDELNKNGISVRYLGFPRKGPMSPAWLQYEQILCHRNPPYALEKAFSGATLDGEVCENQLGEGVRWALLVGVSGTPTTILPNGQVLPGYFEAEDIIKLVFNK